MSRIRADKFVNRAATGAPELTYGAQVVTGYGITGAGGINITGVGTFGSLGGVVQVTDTTDSTSSTTGALVVSGGVGIAKSLFVGNNVTIGGTVTYEDVTNVDSVGIITAQTGVIVTAGRGLQVTAGGLNVDAGIGTFDAGLQVTANGIEIKSGVGTFDGGVSVTDGDFKVGSGVTINAAGVTTFSKGCDFHEALVEEVEIVANKASTGFEQINISKGMIHHFTTLETECFIPDIISNVGINTELNIGDAITVSVACSAVATGWAATVYIDGQSAASGNNQTEWNGGSAPSSGGASGSYDMYTYNIIKRADAGFIVFANKSNFA